MTRRVELSVATDWIEAPVQSQRRRVDPLAEDAGAGAAVLRSGLVVAEVSETRLLRAYDPEAIDGTETPVGVLVCPVPMDTGASDIPAVVLVSGTVHGARIHGIDQAGADALALQGLYVI